MKSSNKVVPAYKDYETMLEEFTDKVVFARSVLQDYADKVIICHLLGMDRYNGTEGEYQLEQELINKGIPMLNNTIDLINYETAVKSPYLQETLHSRIRSKLLMRYGFLYDGLHARDCLKLKWSRLFVKSLFQNLMNDDPLVEN